MEVLEPRVPDDQPLLVIAVVLISHLCKRCRSELKLVLSPGSGGGGIRVSWTLGCPTRHCDLLASIQIDRGRLTWSANLTGLGYPVAERGIRALRANRTGLPLAGHSTRRV